MWVNSHSRTNRDIVSSTESDFTTVTRTRGENKASKGVTAKTIPFTLKKYPFTLASLGQEARGVSPSREGQTIKINTDSKKNKLKGLFTRKLKKKKSFAFAIIHENISNRTVCWDIICWWRKTTIMVFSTRKLKLLSLQEFFY